MSALQYVYLKRFASVAQLVEQLTLNQKKQFLPLFAVFGNP